MLETMQLPIEYIRYTRETMGEELFSRYLHGLDNEPPVSIRLNPLKAHRGGWKVEGGERVPWCSEGYYLGSRPTFTFDPLLHAGCYYVQEAASMFISHVLRQYVDKPVSILDLCAAPGGKSTAAISAVPAGSTLVANEPVRQRASILSENIQKWGYPECTVTNAYPRDFRKSRLTFDVVICDVPCSGEGMFRKDPKTIGEWSQQNVEKCWRLQRDIVTDAWACLKPGGLLVYSTCTLNTRENEENVSWMLSELDGCEVLPVHTEPEWNITGSLLPGFNEPVYRFIPGISRSEGLFMCVLRKVGVSRLQTRTLKASNPDFEGFKVEAHCKHVKSPVVPLSYQQAMAYLRGEALTLPPDTPRGPVEVSFIDRPLGPAKNIGARANNLYPKEWRIKTTHIPNEYEAILKPA